MMLRKRLTFKNFLTKLEEVKTMKTPAKRNLPRRRERELTEVILNQFILMAIKMNGHLMVVTLYAIFKKTRQ